MTDVYSSALEIIDQAMQGNPKACITCSFQPSGVALLHVLLQSQPNIPVLFLDTGYHFKEVYEYKDRLQNEWGFNLVTLSAETSVADQEARWGKLYQTEPDRCCEMRKVRPLMEGLSQYEMWFTGLRRDQSPTRAHIQPEEGHVFPNGVSIRKINPFYNWTQRDIDAYLTINEIPILPLIAQGYTSIGCEPCTSKPVEGGHGRSGRWGGKKLECGLHTISMKVA